MIEPQVQHDEAEPQHPRLWSRADLDEARQWLFNPAAWKHGSPPLLVLVMAAAIDRWRAEERPIAGK